MKLKIPLLNAINFAIIFGILSYLGTELFGPLYLNIIIWLAIGFLVGLIIEFIFPSVELVGGNHRKLPDKVSTKLILIPSILLILLIAVSAFYISGYEPFSFTGQTVKEENESSDEIIIIQEDTNIEGEIEESNLECELIPEIECTNLLVQPEKNKIMLDILNNFDENLRRVSIRINNINSLKEICSLDCVTGCAGGRTSYADQSSTWVSVECEDLPSIGSNFEASVDFTYTDSDGLPIMKSGIIDTVTE